jgi:hypothetical protein
MFNSSSPIVVSIAHAAVICSIDLQVCFWKAKRPV